MNRSVFTDPTEKQSAAFRGFLICGSSEKSVTVNGITEVFRKTLVGVDQIDGAEEVLVTVSLVGAASTIANAFFFIYVPPFMYFI